MSKVMDALNRAVDWLEQHPDKHIKVDLAKTAEGRVCWPTDPAADCFCALGRFVVEMDINAPEDEWEDGYLRLTELLKDENLSTYAVYDINDSLWNLSPAHSIRGLRKLLATDREGINVDSLSERIVTEGRYA